MGARAVVDGTTEFLVLWVVSQWRWLGTVGLLMMLVLLGLMLMAVGGAGWWQHTGGGGRVDWFLLPL